MHAFMYGGAIALLAISAVPAQARHHHTHHYTRIAVHHRADSDAQIVGHPAGCPGRLFCGCGAAVEIFGRPLRELFSVSAWYRFPRATCAAGRAVIFGHHHVAAIRECHGDGTATLYDANSGRGLTRVHRRSIAGLTVVDPHGAHVADSGRQPARYAAHHHRHYARYYQQPNYFAWDRPRRYAYRADSWQRQWR
jgi:hypothetical protein